MLNIPKSEFRKTFINSVKSTRIYGIFTDFRIWWETGQLVIQAPILNLISKSGILSSFYYFALSRRFDLEHRAVIAGRLLFLNKLREPDALSNSLLRRNIHRLEKGLSMRPRRSVFALDFVGRTVDIYCKIADISFEEPTREMIWSRDVLQAYFDACAHHPEVVPIYARFRAAPSLATCVGKDAFPYIGDLRIPYNRAEVPNSTIDIDELLALARRRRSVRWFLPKAPDRNLVDRAIEVGSLSPTACNRLPYHYKILDDPELAVKAAKLAGGTGGFAEQIPMIIVVLGNLGAYFHERDRHLIYIDASLSTMSTVLALEAQGLSTCLINWSDVPQREAGMKKLLSLPDHERPIMLIAVGYADPIGIIPYSSKKEIDLLRSFNLAGC